MVKFGVNFVVLWFLGNLRNWNTCNIFGSRYMHMNCRGPHSMSMWLWWTECGEKDWCFLLKQTAIWTSVRDDSCLTRMPRLHPGSTKLVHKLANSTLRVWSTSLPPQHMIFYLLLSLPFSLSWTANGIINLMTTNEATSYQPLPFH